MQILITVFEKRYKTVHNILYYILYRLKTSSMRKILFFRASSTIIKINQSNLTTLVNDKL